MKLNWTKPQIVLAVCTVNLLLFQIIYAAVLFPSLLWLAAVAALMCILVGLLAVFPRAWCVTGKCTPRALRLTRTMLCSVDAAGMFAMLAAMLYMAKGLVLPAWLVPGAACTVLLLVAVFTVLVNQKETPKKIK